VLLRCCWITTKFEELEKKLRGFEIETKIAQWFADERIATQR
jgi:hypothetical protein